METKKYVKPRQLKTVKQVLVRMRNVLEYGKGFCNEYYFLCHLPTTLKGKGVITEDLSEEVEDYIKEQKPTAEVNKDFYNHSLFDGSTIVWWSSGKGTVKEILKEKKRFLKHIENKL